MAEKNIYQKLQHIQTNLKAPKNQRNEFGKYNYRNCEDILEAVKPIMNDVGCVLTITDKICMIGDRYYVEATATLIDSESGESISNTAYAREEEDKKGWDASQITGGTSSYARKYALNGLFCIDDTKDADTKIGKDCVDAIMAELARTGIGKKGILQNYKINSFEEMTPEQYQDAMSRLRKNPDKPPKNIPIVEQKHINSLFAEAQRVGMDIAEILRHYNISDVHKMDINQFKDAMDKLNKIPDKQPDPSTIPPETDEEGLPWNTPAR